MSVANTSKHLQQLQAAGLVPARRSDKHVHDVLGDERVLDAVSTLRGIAQALQRRTRHYGYLHANRRQAKAERQFLGHSGQWPGKSRRLIWFGS